MQHNDEARTWIAGILKIGSWGSAGLLFLGLALALFRPPAAAHHHYDWQELLAALGRFDSGAILQIGILTLLLTPVARLVVAMVSFARAAEYRYAWISGAVLLVVISSVLLRLAQ